MDGDGFEDIAVSSPGFGPRNIGAVLILSGGALGEELEGLAPESQIPLSSRHIIGFISDPEAVQSTQFGFALSALGDINADGRPDLVVGAKDSSMSGSLRGGAAYVYLGREEPFDSDTAPDIVIAGQRLRADSGFGSSVAGGLLRGDGAGGAILYVGAPSAERDGDLHGEVGAVHFSKIVFE